MPLQSCKAQKPSGAQDCSRLEPRIASVPERSREFFANLTASKKAAGTVKPFALLRRCCLRVLIYSHTMVFSNGKGLTPISPQIPFLSNQLRYLWKALLTSTTLRDSSHQSKLSKCKLHLYKCDPSAAMQPMTKCSTIAHKPDPVSASSIQSSLGLASSLRHVTYFASPGIKNRCSCSCMLSEAAADCSCRISARPGCPGSGSCWKLKVSASTAVSQGKSSMLSVCLNCAKLLATISDQTRGEATTRRLRLLACGSATAKLRFIKQFERTHTEASSGAAKKASERFSGPSNGCQCLLDPDPRPSCPSHSVALHQCLHRRPSRQHHGSVTTGELNR